jgi:hypothetical protein
MNAIAERWIGGCRRELLDRTLIWNQGHLRRILRQYETHHNRHRPHRSLLSLVISLVSVFHPDCAWSGLFVTG